MNHSPELSEAIQALVPAAAAGNPHAVETLFELLLPRVRNLVRYLTRSDRDVDDLSQEALARVYRGLGGYREEGRFISWADRIVARTVFATLRQRSQEPATPLAPAEMNDLLATTSSETTGLVIRRQLTRLLEQLPLEQRSAIVCHHALGQSIREIAEDTGVAEETIRSRLRLGKGRLRHMLRGEWLTSDAPEARPGRMAG